MCGWDGWGWACGGGHAMGIGMLFFWMILIGLIVALVVFLLKHGGVAKRPESAVEILEKAYASGDISREEFLQKKEDLLGERKLPAKQ